MTTDSNQITEQSKALEHLDGLLSEITARQLRKSINELFYGYLNSDHADSQNSRNSMCVTHSSLLRFFSKISKLKEIDRFDRN